MQPGEPRRVLIDENLSVHLRLWMPAVAAVTVEHLGWKAVRNGDLVRRAKDQGFAVLVTADQLLASTPRVWIPLACVYVTDSNTSRVRPKAGDIERACLDVLPGQVMKVYI